VAAALEDAEEILVVGPSSAKLDFLPARAQARPRAGAEDPRRRDARSSNGRVSSPPTSATTSTRKTACAGSFPDGSWNHAADCVRREARGRHHSPCCRDRGSGCRQPSCDIIQ
jgi:hypothetical protein